MVQAVGGQEGLSTTTQTQSGDSRVNAVLSQLVEQANIASLGGDDQKAAALLQQAREMQPKLTQLFRLSDGIDRAANGTDAEKASALKAMMSFVNANGGNPIAMYPYLAQNGYTPEILEQAGFTPNQIAQAQSVAAHQRTITPVTQADMDKLTEEQKAQVAELEQVIADLRARIEEMQAQQRAQIAQVTGETSGVDTGPNTRPTEGNAPMEGEAAPEGSVPLSSFSVPVRV